MTDSTHYFARVRETLAQPPSMDTLGALLLMMQQWPESEELRLAKEYVETHLADWPEMLQQLYRWDEAATEENWQKLRELLNSAMDGGGQALVEAFRSRLKDWPVNLRRMSVPEPSHPAWGLVTYFESDTLLLEDDSSLQHALFRARIQELNLKSTNPDDEDIRNFLELVDLSELRSLNLESNLLSDRGLTMFLDALGDATLEELWLGWNEISAAGLSRLAEEEALSNLKRLQFENNEIVGPEIAILAGAPHLKQVDFLELYNNDMMNSGIEALVDNFDLPNVRILYLDNNQFTDEGAMTIANSPAFSQLRELHLDRNVIGDEGALALLESEHLKGLEVIRISFNDEISESTMERLNKDSRFDFI